MLRGKSRLEKWCLDVAGVEVQMGSQILYNSQSCRKNRRWPDDGLDKERREREEPGLSYVWGLGSLKMNFHWLGWRNIQSWWFREKIRSVESRGVSERGTPGAWRLVRSKKWRRESRGEDCRCVAWAVSRAEKPRRGPVHTEKMAGVALDVTELGHIQW